MRNLVIPMFLILIPSMIIAQSGKYNLQLDSILPEKAYEHVSVKMIYSDSLTSTFLIWVKTTVPLHKHEWHTEQVVVLDGEANMQIGENIFHISSGDILFIPENTPHGVVVTSEVPLKVLSIQAPQFTGSDRILLEE